MFLSPDDITSILLGTNKKVQNDEVIYEANKGYFREVDKNDLRIPYIQNEELFNVLFLKD